MAHTHESHFDTERDSQTRKYPSRSKGAPSSPASDTRLDTRPDTRSPADADGGDVTAVDTFHRACAAIECSSENINIKDVLNELESG